MKKSIKSYSVTLTLLLLSTFVFSLILAALYNGGLITYKFGETTSYILSLIVFFISAIILGIKQKNKGLLNGIVLALIYVSVSLFIGMDFLKSFNVIKFISKIILILIGCILGVNLRR